MDVSNSSVLIVDTAFHCGTQLDGRFGPLNTNSYAKNLSHHESTTHQQSLGPFRLHEADEVLSQK
jgi:hypothetical protein